MFVYVFKFANTMYYFFGKNRILKIYYIGMWTNFAYYNTQNISPAVLDGNGEGINKVHEHEHQLMFAVLQ